MATRTMTDAELTMQGMDLLFSALGPAAALRFLALLQDGQDDSVEMSRRLYANQTIDDIFERAEANWKG